MIDSFRLIDWLIDWLTRALQMKLRRGQVTFTISSAKLLTHQTQESGHLDYSLEQPVILISTVCFVCSVANYSLGILDLNFCKNLLPLLLVFFRFPKTI